MSSTLPMRARARSAIGLAMLLACCACGFALDPSLDISQYAHTAWKIREGFTKGYTSSITQTPEGYLWLANEFGLIRFDGARVVPWQPPGDQHLPSTHVTHLLAARDGSLWIGTAKGLASWKDGKLTQYPELTGQQIAALLEDREGTVWSGSLGFAPYGRLCAIEKGTIRCYGEDGKFATGVLSLYEDRNGALWAGSRGGMWRWKPGPPKFYPVPDSPEGTRAFAEGDDGALLIGTRSGIRRLVGEKTEVYPLPGTSQKFDVNRMLLDRIGGLWIGTRNRGLVHVHQGTTDAFAHSDGLSSENVSAIFEDHEGNIWVSTLGGLDRFREFAVPTFSEPQGLSSANTGAVLGARDGSVWISTAGGLNRWKNGKFTVPQTGGAKHDGKLNGLAPHALFEDAHGRIWISITGGIGYLENERFILSRIPGANVFSFVNDTAGNLWMNDLDRGLLGLSARGDIQQIPWASLGRKDSADTLAADPLHGGLWLGFYQGGIAYFAENRLRASYSATDGLGQGRVNRLRLEPDGTLWAATEGGLSRLKDGRIVTLTSKNGLPCDTVHWTIEDDAHSLWLYTPCGLVGIAPAELNAWLADPQHRIKVTVFDSFDGVRSPAAVGGSGPLAAKSQDGKLWFVSPDGVSVVDPNHFPVNKLLPPVHIEQVTADRKTYYTSSENGKLRMPPQLRDLEIDYTALSLVVPEKVLFRYKLEGWDRDWQDVGNRRQAFYANLPPRNYRFRVMASNNSGVWNEAGTFLDFSVAPAYYQALWFRSLCVIAFLGLLAGLYRLRLRQVAHQFNMRAEERVNERTRVARDLHDTLLQSFQGVLLKFHAVTYMLTDRPEAQKSLETVIEQARNAIIEGRDAVYGLRSSTVVTNELAPALSTIGEELAANQTDGNRVDFRVHVEGTPRNLSPIVRDEVFRIAGEALRNAFRHACAGRIELEIRYDRRQFRLRVRDDGKGIDPKVLSGDGRPGHYGLPGMHERARQVDGKLTVWSEPGSGTEAELTIPASVAYKKSPAARRPMFFRRGA